MRLTDRFVQFEFWRAGPRAARGVKKERGLSSRLRMLTFPPDYTFLIQFGAFFALLVVLSRVLFSPFLQLLSEREARTVGDAERAAVERSDVQQLATRIEADLAKVRVQAMNEVESVRRSTREEEARLFSAAQAEASVSLAELRSSISTATAQARTALAADAKSMADQMVTRILGRGGRA